MPDVDGFTLARQIKRRPAAAQHSRHHADLGRAIRTTRRAAAGSASTPTSTKPVKHSDLLDTLATLVRRVDPRQTRSRQAPASRHGRRDGALRILVAEDNAVNRKLVTTLLQKRGHTVKAVENGRAAVERSTQPRAPASTSCVMDLQMPEMGGLEATQAIRAREAATGRTLPIVALTAHAMQGDRERCLEAGMDGYLSKPIDVDELLATVERFGERHAKRRREVPASAAG